MTAPYTQSLPELTISSIYPGKLMVSLLGRWVEAYDVIGHTGSSSINIYAVVYGPGWVNLATTGDINKFTATQVKVLDYPGGGEVWRVMTFVRSLNSDETGAFTSGLDMTLLAELRKR